MTLYSEMQELSQNLFSEFKQGTVSYVFSQTGNGPVDDPGASTETEYQLKGATVRGIAFKYSSTGLGVASDLQVSHAFDDRFQFPKISGFYIVDGVRYKIVAVIRKPDAGDVVAFTCIIRK